MKAIKLRETLTAATFIAVLAIFAVISRVILPPRVLPGERRPPASMPSLTAQTVANGDFMRKFEPFAADTVAWRADLRTLRALFVFSVYNQTDKSGLYVDPAVGAGKFAATNEAEVRKTAAKLRAVADTFLSGMNLYAAVIPDKSDYAARFYPGAQPGSAATIFAVELPDFTHIDLSGALDAEAYYRTDLHWEQTKLRPVLAALGTSISGQAWTVPDADAQTAGTFSGVYPGQLSLPMQPDTLQYLDFGGTARYLNERTLVYDDGEIYDFGALTSVDPYNFFLRGPQPVIVLAGDPDADRTLYVFRDSFTSSLAPLIAATGRYREVVLIDLRYIDTRILADYVEFVPESDALFLYGSQILNDSSIFKVN